MNTSATRMGIIARSANIPIDMIPPQLRSSEVLPLLAPHHPNFHLAAWQDDIYAMLPALRDQKPAMTKKSDTTDTPSK